MKKSKHGNQRRTFITQSILSQNTMSSSSLIPAMIGSTTMGSLGNSSSMSTNRPWNAMNQTNTDSMSVMSPDPAPSTSVGVPNGQDWRQIFDRVSDLSAKIDDFQKHNNLRAKAMAEQASDTSWKATDDIQMMHENFAIRQYYMDVDQATNRIDNVLYRLDHDTLYVL